MNLRATRLPRAGSHAPIGGNRHFLQSVVVVHKLENDEMSIICDIYTPVDGDMLGTITYSDGTVEEIPFERQIEINAEIDSLPRPPIAEDNWIPMSPETAEEYFGTR